MSLTSDCFLPPLIQLSGPASFLGSIAFKWSKPKSQFVKVDSKGLRLHKLTSLFHALACGSLFIQSILFWEEDLSKLLISSFGFYIIIFTLITVWVYHVHLDAVIKLINGLISTSLEFQRKCEETNQPKTDLDGREKFIKIMAPMFHWSAMSVPFAFVGGVVWSMPCLNSSFGWYFLEECTGGSRSYINFFLFIFGNTILWSYSIQCAVFAAIGVQMLGAMSIRSFLKHYERTMLSIKFSNSKTLIHSDLKTRKILYENSKIYRIIQLLTDQLNEIHSTWILVPLLFTVSSHQVFSTYGFIKFKGQLNFMSYCLFGILLSQGFFVIMGMFTALGDVHRMSKEVKRKLEKAHTGHKWLQRFHLACPHIKIRFGRLNYVDSLSPLMFENFALAQTANILLMD